MLFPFYIYDKVILQVEINGRKTLYRREDFYQNLGNYTYTNKKRFKLDYCTLQEGHYIHVLADNGGGPQVGLFHTILWHEGSAYIAYTMPKVTNYEENRHFVSRSLKITNAIDESVIYVVPKESFLQRAYVYNTDDDYSEIIRY